MSRVPVSSLRILWAFVCNILLAYMAFFLCRVIFVAENWNVFSAGWDALSLADLVKGSLLFDTSAILYANILYALLMLLPLHFAEGKRWQAAARLVFVVFNAVCIIGNLCDCVYFQYTGRRTTATVFNEFSSENNLAGVFGAEVLRHWYIVLAGLLIVASLWLLYRKPKGEFVRPAGARQWTGYYLVRIVIFALYVPITIAGMRGGATTAVRPITISNAGQYVNRPAEAAIVLNTPFSIIRTIGKDVFHVPQYFADEADMEEIFTPVHVPQPDTLRTKNVVILIVESFGREYIGALNATATGEQFPTYTPFIDSLCQHSLTFDYSLCNGRKSIDGMPSILSAIPMFVEPFVLTPASLNKVGGIAAELGNEGWYSAFFHGAENGSMGFQAFARATGFKDYFGRDEYNDDKRFGGDSDFDGLWAIWDEPFLQFFAQKMNEFEQPFVSSVFTASSHHPYRVPEQYADTFPDADDNIIHKCIRYTDHSLRRFFSTASRMPWYRNTVFVITSDHTNLCTYAPYATDLGGFCSPVIFFDPSGEMPRGRRHAIAQHIDIMPTLLGWIGTKRPYVAFGKDLLATPDSLTWAVNYYNGTYQYAVDSLLLQWNGEETTAIYDFRHDWMQKENIIGHPRRQELEQRLKAIIQQYMLRMKEDRLTAGQ